MHVHAWTGGGNSLHTRGRALHRRTYDGAVIGLINGSAKLVPLFHMVFQILRVQVVVGLLLLI